MKQIISKQCKQKVLSLENDVALKKHSLKTKKFWSWPIKVLILTFCFSVGFSIFSELLNSKVGLCLSLLIIVIFLVINVGFDVVGVATTVCERSAFETLSAKADKPAKVALIMVNNSEKVCSFCCDIIGDICGILSGSAGASLIFKFGFTLTGAESILFSTLISSLIASITVFSKAIGKNLAIKKSSSIVYCVAKLGCVFFKKRGLKNGKTKE